MARFLKHIYRYIEYLLTHIFPYPKARFFSLPHWMILLPPPSSFPLALIGFLYKYYLMRSFKIYYQEIGRSKRTFWRTVFPKHIERTSPTNHLKNCLHLTLSSWGEKEFLMHKGKSSKCGEWTTKCAIISGAGNKVGQCVEQWRLSVQQPLT